MPCIPEFRNKKLAKNTKIVLKELSRLTDSISTLSFLLGRTSSKDQWKNENMKRSENLSARQLEDASLIDEKVLPQMAQMLDYSRKIKEILEAMDRRGSNK